MVKKSIINWLSTRERKDTKRILESPQFKTLHKEYILLKKQKRDCEKKIMALEEKIAEEKRIYELQTEELKKETQKLKEDYRKRKEIVQSAAELVSKIAFYQLLRSSNLALKDRSFASDSDKELLLSLKLNETALEENRKISLENTILADNLKEATSLMPIYAAKLAKELIRIKVGNRDFSEIPIAIYNGEEINYAGDNFESYAAMALNSRHSEKIDKTEATAKLEEIIKEKLKKKIYRPLKIGKYEIHLNFMDSKRKSDVATIYITPAADSKKKASETIKKYADKIIETMTHFYKEFSKRYELSFISAKNNI